MKEVGYYGEEVSYYGEKVSYYGGIISASLWVMVVVLMNMKSLVVLAFLSLHSVHFVLNFSFLL